MTRQDRKRLMWFGGFITAVVVALTLVASAVALAAAGWNPQASGTTQDIHGVACISPTEAWAVGAGGAILYTSDGGATWVSQTSGTTSDLLGVTFGDASHGWAVGEGGTILVTGDGGVTWTPQTSGTAVRLSAVTFKGVVDGWAVGAAGAVLHTSDGGATWIAQTSGTVHDLSGVTFVDAATGWAVGAAGTILHTADGGASWLPEPSPATAGLAGVAFADAGNGWAVGAAGAVLHTVNGGATWVAQASGTTQDLSAIVCAGSNRGWAVGVAGAVVSTTNAGVAWKNQLSGTAQDLSGVTFCDAKHGWAVGAGGTTINTISGGVPDVTAPATKATGLQPNDHSGWRNSRRTITLKSSDGGAGVAATFFTLDGGSEQTYTGPFAVEGAGSHTVVFWSTDLVGNVEASHTGFVNIDTARPTCYAIRSVNAKPQMVVKLGYRVSDPHPTCGRAAVTITVFRGRTRVKTIRIPRALVNKNLACSYTADLASGTYTWVVTARDVAGNVQVKKATRRLTVTPWRVTTIADAQRRLVALRFLPSGAVNGTADYRTQQALIAFQAWNGLARDGVAGTQTMARLGAVARPRPRAQQITGHYAEIFRSLGVTLFVNHGRLVRAVHCSTGRPGLATPAGRFSVYMKSRNWYSTEYHSWMPYASFFTGGCAFHAYPDVPAYPASHGCVRLSAPEAPWVYGFLPLGTPVIVF